MDSTPVSRMHGHRPDRHRGLLAILAVLILMVVAAVALLRHVSNTRTPDLATLVASSQVKAQDSASQAALARQFAQIARRASWLSGKASGVSDSCGLASQESQVFLGQASWEAQCQRQETLCYVFSGDLAGRLSELQGVLSTQGWSRPADGTSSPAGALTAASRQPVTFRPAVADPPGLPGKISLQVAWAARGQSLRAVDSLVPAGRVPGSNEKFSRVLEFRPVAPSTLTTRIPRPHGYILAISITVQYYQKAFS